jgi:hypothetical protein
MMKVNLSPRMLRGTRSESSVSASPSVPPFVKAGSAPAIEPHSHVRAYTTIRIDQIDTNG